MIRIGFSKDVHRFEQGEALVLGGIKIEHYMKCVAHSDGDCLLHAIAEAFLGALALGDLGKLFPDNDDKYIGYDSKKILSEIYELVKNEGYTVSNLDCMISLEKPKLRRYIDTMRQVVADILKCDMNQVSIKATTHERLGFVGNEEGIICEAVVLINNDL